MENYNLLMEREIAKLSVNKTEKKPTLLLHVCCAPCSSGCIERLNNVFETTFYYYNPNIDTQEEYNLRAKEVIRLAEKFKTKYVIEEYDGKEYYDFVKGYETEKEGGLRCEKCFTLRLDKSGRYAKENGYEYFTTTLTISPLKNANLLNCIGEDKAQKYGVKFLNSDFKKRGGYLRSIELSKEFNFYRQNYCGCIFSKKEALDREKINKKIK